MRNSENLYGGFLKIDKPLKISSQIPPAKPGV